MKRKRLRSTGAEGPTARWNAMPWKPVDMSSADLGDFEDSVFFGLEELDGNAYKITKREGSYKIEETGVSATASVADQSMEGEDIMDTDESAGKDLSVEKAPLSKKEIKRAKRKENQELEKQKKKTAKAEARDNAKIIQHDEVNEEQVETSEPIEDALWGTVKLHGLLVKSLQKLNFHVPTPIQAAAIPLTLKGKCDIVGAAETGSGKTLAFCLPVLDSLLRNWSQHASQRTPYALIISPTRELTMQITAVLKEVCLQLRESNHKIEVVTIVGGMSEQKQRRQLSGHGKPVHIVVATPGRLCDMIQDEGIVAFQDMSCVRFLIVDEADRIVEEGHFPELHRVFSRIRDHETIAQRGQVPKDVYARRKEGTYEADMHPAQSKSRSDDYMKALDVKGSGVDKPKKQRLAFAKMPSKEEMVLYRKRVRELGKSNLTDADLKGLGMQVGDDDDEGEQSYDGDAASSDFDDEDELETHFDPMPSLEEIEEARRNTPAIPLDEMDYSEDQESGGEDEEGSVPTMPPASLIVLHRQTLLYSATALKAQLRVDHVSKKKQKKVKGLAGEHVKDLPYHMQQLLSTVATEKQRDIKVVDVTGVGAATAAKTSVMATTKASSENANGGDSTAISLPRGLKQFQILVPMEDKDVLAYYYLLKQGGRTLLFVNSIKTARRVDGLLRALGINCRTIHAQLQQRQRLRSLESFRAAPIGVLVATDVAARGLDIPKIQTVLHYDVARSPQVYVHRSGRTARANADGTSLSLVAPEDLVHHENICTLLGVSALPPYSVDGSEMGILRERVKLAKKIFTQSFVASQKIKESSWLEQSAAEADLELDDYMVEEDGTKEKQQEQSKAKKRQLDRARAELKAMLDKPVALAKQGISSRNKGFVVFAK